jgi:CubicO group peptidase (beta-lactamase class C family)
MILEPTISGYVAPGFEQVREVFAENFRSRGETGAACSAYREGECVVDLWGGDARDNQPWQEDTLVLVYSLSKGITGLAVATAISQGLFNYDMPVSEIWPEFAAAGKAQVTIRQLLNQQAGLCAIETKLNPEVMQNPRAMAEILAEQKPQWPIGEKNGNHAYTLGWLASELIYRSDPKKRSLGEFLRDELTTPLDCEFYLGLPDTVDKTRIAEIEGITPASMFKHRKTLGVGMVLYMAIPWTLAAKTWGNPPVKIHGGRGPADFNIPEYWRVENGGSGGISNARSIARLYGEFATGGSTLSLTPATLADLQAPPSRPHSGWFDPIIQDDVRYSLCFEKPAPNNNFGTSEEAYGTFAIGGSYAFADPATRTGYSFVTRHPGYYVWGDPRETSLREAVFAVR